MTQRRELACPQKYAIILHSLLNRPTHLYISNSYTRTHTHTEFPLVFFLLRKVSISSTAPECNYSCFWHLPGRQGRGGGSGRLNRECTGREEEKESGVGGKSFVISFQCAAHFLPFAAFRRALSSHRSPSFSLSFFISSAFAVLFLCCCFVIDMKI